MVSVTDKDLYGPGSQRLKSLLNFCLDVNNIQNIQINTPKMFCTLLFQQFSIFNLLVSLQVVVGASSGFSV